MLNWIQLAIIGKRKGIDMNYKKQMELKSDPDLLAIEEIVNPKIDELNYLDWLNKKRAIGKKKFNRPIDKRNRRLAIKKKQFGLN